MNDFYKNIKTGKIFASIDDEKLINPAGKIIELNENFIEIEFGTLNEIQKNVLNAINQKNLTEIDSTKISKENEINKMRLQKERDLKIAESFAKDFGSDKYLIKLADQMIKHMKNKK